MHGNQDPIRRAHHVLRTIRRILRDSPQDNWEVCVVKPGWWTHPELHRVGGVPRWSQFSYLEYALNFRPDNTIVNSVVSGNADGWGFIGKYKVYEVADPTEWPNSRISNLENWGVNLFVTSPGRAMNRFEQLFKSPGVSITAKSSGPPRIQFRPEFKEEYGQMDVWREQHSRVLSSHVIRWSRQFRGSVRCRCSWGIECMCFMPPPLFESGFDVQEFYESGGLDAQEQSYYSGFIEPDDGYSSYEDEDDLP